jgi:hypothetical protein
MFSFSLLVIQNDKRKNWKHDTGRVVLADISQLGLSFLSMKQLLIAIVHISIDSYPFILFGNALSTLGSSNTKIRLLRPVPKQSDSSISKLLD